MEIEASHKPCMAANKPGFHFAGNEAGALSDEDAVLKLLGESVQHGQLHRHWLVHSGFTQQLQRDVQFEEPRLLLRRLCPSRRRHSPVVP